MGGGSKRECRHTYLQLQGKQNRWPAEGEDALKIISIISHLDTRWFQQKTMCYDG